MRGCRHADGTPAPCVIGGRAYGPDAVDLYNQGKLAQNIKRTRWQKGTVVEAAYTLYSNHAGGYSCTSHFASISLRLSIVFLLISSRAADRLCKQSANVNVTEECFEAGHLDFVGDTHIVQWGADKSSRREIPAVYTSNGTHPAGSMWARGPIPTCAGANGGYVWRHGSAIDCEPYPWRPENLRKVRAPYLPELCCHSCSFCRERSSLSLPACVPLPHVRVSGGWQTQFPPPLPGLYGWGTDYKPGPNNHWPFLIIDRLQVPSGLPDGDYVLSWRWDCEQGAQVWTTCGAPLPF